MVFRPFGKNGKLNIAVFGQGNNNMQEEMGDFELFCASSSQHTIIKSGSMQFELLAFPVINRKYAIETNEIGKLEVF